MWEVGGEGLLLLMQTGLALDDAWRRVSKTEGTDISATGLGGGIHGRDGKHA